jgi:hypothetical protein
MHEKHERVNQVIKDTDAQAKLSMKNRACFGSVQQTAELKLEKIRSTEI